MGNGERDLAIVLEFDPNKDTIVLSQTASTPATETVEVEYTLGALPHGLPPVTGIQTRSAIAISITAIAFL